MERGLIPPFLFDPPFLVSLLLWEDRSPLYTPLRSSDFRLFSHNSESMINSRHRHRLIEYNFEPKSSNQRQKKRNKRGWWKNHEKENSPNDIGQQFFEWYRSTILRMISVNNSPNDIGQQPLLKLSIIISAGALKVNIFFECILVHFTVAIWWWRFINSWIIVSRCQPSLLCFYPCSSEGYLS